MNMPKIMLMEFVPHQITYIDIIVPLFIKQAYYIHNSAVGPTGWGFYQYQNPIFTDSNCYSESIEFKLKAEEESNDVQLTRHELSIWKSDSVLRDMMKIYKYHLKSQYCFYSYEIYKSLRNG